MTILDKTRSPDWGFQSHVSTPQLRIRLQQQVCQSVGNRVVAKGRDYNSFGMWYPGCDRGPGRPRVSRNLKP